VRARRSEIEAALPGITDELLNVQTVLDAARTDLASVKAALAEKRQELETTVATFDREVTTRLEGIARRPEALFAEAVVVRAVLAELSKSDANCGPVRPSKPGPSTESATVRRATDVYEATPVLDGEAAVRVALALHASAGAFSLHAMIGLHAMFVAGTTPVVVGSRGYDLLRAYACAVAGDRLHWIPVGSSTMEPSDLLGRFDLASRQIVPAASGLLDVVHDATVSGRLHVVVLEGFNRAPSEGYLAPILDAIEAGRLGDVARAIPLAHPSIVAADDPYHGLARLTWPPSLLVACLPTDGSATLPVSAAVWRHLALLDADDRDRSITAGFSGTNENASIAEIPPTSWPPRRTPVVVAGAPEAAGGWATAPLAHAMSLTDRDSSDATRLQDTLRAMGLAASDAAGVAIAATLVARSAADKEAIEDALRSQGIDAPGWRTVWTEADRLRS
jgi:hypothetical protein